MKRLCILFFCALFPMLFVSCNDKGTVLYADSAVFFASDDNYSVVIREKYVGFLRHGKVTGKVIGYEREIIPLTLYAEEQEVSVLCDENNMETVTLRYDDKEVCLFTSKIRADKTVFDYFNDVKNGEINARFISGYGNIYYYCGYYEKEKLLYGVMFDEDFVFLASIGSI